MMFEIDKAMRILKRIVKSFDVPVVDLIQVQTNDPYKILVTTILSARTKDSVTARAVRRLFEKAGNLRELAALEPDVIAQLIYPVGFYKNKALFLKDLPGFLDARFGGRIPKTVDELLKLPGVGRKTANLVSAVAFKRPAICVDTHVHRITNRWGYVDTKTPHQTEMKLREILTKKHWLTINTTLVAFGQNICSPIVPRCTKCSIYQYCARVGVEKCR
jgi:endonuclease III